MAVKSCSPLLLESPPQDSGSASSTKSPLRFPLLHAWLQRCDTHQKCQNLRTVEANFPTRVLDLSTPHSLRLVSGQDVFNFKGSSRRYIALSHCWGNTAPGEIPRYCTTRQNINSRETGQDFRVGSLPLTFRDAIEVSQGLGIRYLWIDSLCIIQGCPEDWIRESKRMEDVYAGAYCTIAATSAANSEAGFLRHEIDNRHRTTNFAQEVDAAPLNRRAWVLQERFLSRRILHFSSYQIYFECGSGIYSEDYTQMKSIVGTEKYIDLDPHFPDRLSSCYEGDVVKFLQSLLEKYSTRELSIPTDRAVALSGLLTRIGSTLGCEQSYGVIGKFLHRTLFWQWTSPRKKIKFDEDNKIPSWSWMGYEGGVGFYPIEFGKFGKFRKLHLTSDGGALVTNVWEIEDCGLQKDLGADSTAIRYQIVDLSGELRGWVTYDDESYSTLPLKWAVVLGKPRVRQELYLLVIRPRAGGDYERLGIGMIEAGCISRKDVDVMVI
ncbi:heterokaryon incompatibility protein-domain-containing protein [Cladorrhinum sp. PSN259]|nr:heterokaryon incompatibility protein-domain-containing protein [Cladorrhinum sp. PSN259]